MDPLTQGALGAAVVQAAPTKTKNFGVSGVLGFLSGMAADLDSLIQSSNDPLIYLEYHRHFTHSLAFIPLGGLLCALVIQLTLGKRWQLSFPQTFMFCMLGYGTHALLDASTSYGTLLLWPFSDERMSWSFVPIVDPLFTVPLVALCVVAAFKKTRKAAWVALIWVGVYIAAGATQHAAAVSKGYDLAASRGHAPLRLQAKPSFANILVWKTIYESDGRFHVDAVRVGLEPVTFEGTSVPRLDIDRDLPWLEAGTQQAIDVERFRGFSKGFVALHPTVANRVIDVRYSFVPNEVSPLWSLELKPQASTTDHAAYLSHRDNPRESFSRLWQMIAHD
jgi:inner membrane protein